MPSQIEVPRASAPEPEDADKRVNEKVLGEQYQFLLRYARSLVQNHEEQAEDLVQDTYERALKSKDQFQQGTDIRAWLTTILFRRNLELKRRDKFWDVTTDPEDYYLRTGAEASQGHELDAKQLQELLSRLSPDHAQILNFLGQEYEYKEIAEELDLPLNTVKSRTNRARKAFAQILLEAGYIDTDNGVVVRFLDLEPKDA